MSEKQWLVTIWTIMIINFAFIAMSFSDIKKQNAEIQTQIKELKLELNKRGK